MTDPTLQASGGLYVSFKNETNWTGQNSVTGAWWGIPVTPNPPTYAPMNQPPPAWTAGKEYRFFNQPVAFSVGAPIPWKSSGSSGASVAGATPLFGVTDMSAQTVVPGKQYLFTVDTPIGGPSIRTFLLISGSAAGSTIVPGFGLYNLGTAPMAWTYLTPASFDGSYAISLCNPYFAEPLVLSATYLPLRWTNFFQNCSRLVYAMSGTTPSWFSQTSGDEAPNAEPNHEATLDILSPEDDYVVVRTEEFTGP